MVQLENRAGHRSRRQVLLAAIGVSAIALAVAFGTYVSLRAQRARAAYEQIRKNLRELAAHDPDAGPFSLQPPASTLAEEQEQTIARIWELLLRGDQESFAQALRELRDLPAEVLTSARYGLEGDRVSWLDTFTIRGTRIRLVDEAKARPRQFEKNFEDTIRQVSADEARQMYEQLDSLFAGVMRCAKEHWAEALPPPRMATDPPIAFGFTTAYRAGLIKCMLRLGLAEDQDFRARLEKRDTELRDLATKPLKEVEKIP